MSQIKLIVSDLDGTLLLEDKSLPLKMKELVKRLDDLGVRFTLASGRNYHVMKTYVDQLELSFPVISNNGATIYQHHKLIDDYPLEPSALREVLRKLEQNNIAFLVYGNTKVYTLVEDSRLYTFSKRLKQLDVLEYVQSVDQLPQEAYYKVIVIVNNNQFAMIQSWMKNYPLLQFHQSEGEVSAIVSRASSKGNAILKIADQYQIEPQEILVFGDNYNDLSMFRIGAYGVAMSNAEDCVKEVAQSFTDSNIEDGVLQFIEKHIVGTE